ncbi:ABC transporter permease [Isoptericola sp. b441]|uniref:ABC transporter permease n=2 Tax=Actinotalea lenta TaxID=3064654 RepID=A0ABT9DCT8_9CELL|nr:ABC transporter permease [Isoptericola sp. b441]MDO8108008.1 ABC transporter permease [Isoptericola sp. b441]MDO8120322.1 ABC transporter permease [Isoptericola sp. b490]
MLTMILRRLASGVAVLIVVAVLTFVLLNLSAGNVARNILGDQATPDAVAAKNAELGLDQPVLTRLGDWLSGAVHLDFGKSFFTNEPVFTAIGSRLPVTLAMVIASILLIAVFATLLGMLAAVRRGWVDSAVQVLAIVGNSIPGFVIGVLLVWLLAITWQVFNAVSNISPGSGVQTWVGSLTLPVIALVINGLASAAQQIRSAFIRQLDQDYVRTLRSRGISEREILFKHVLRSAAPAGLTVLSLQFIGLLGGVVIIESIFAIPGMGRLAVDATTKGDLPIVMGVVIYTVVVVIVVNLIVDIINGWLNPKVRVS